MKIEALLEIMDDFNIVKKGCDVPHRDDRIHWKSGDPYEGQFDNNLQIALMNEDFRKSLYGFF